MTCSCLMQSWLSWRRLCPYIHTHKHTLLNIYTWTYFYTHTFSHCRPLIYKHKHTHTRTRRIKALPYQLHSNKLQQQELTEISKSALYTTPFTKTNDTASNEQGTKCLLRWISSWGWLAGRATGHQPILRKWEKPLWGWSSRHWVRIKKKKKNC